MHMVLQPRKSARLVGAVPQTGIGTMMMETRRSLVTDRRAQTVEKRTLVKHGIVAEQRERPLAQFKGDGGRAAPS
jgi:hypothetical protein